ncbi:MAG: hypothetical protein ACTSO9_01905 [Candidatus Helarchaeota archaeon]
MNNNEIIKRLVTISKEIMAIRANIQELQYRVDDHSKYLFDNAINLLKDCIHEVSKIGFKIK